MSWRRTDAAVLIEAVKQGHQIEVLTFGDVPDWYDPPRRVDDLKLWGPADDDLAVRLEGGPFFGPDTRVTWRFAHE